MQKDSYEFEPNIELNIEENFFQAKINSYHCHFQTKKGFLHIYGDQIKQKQYCDMKFNASYQVMSLPKSIVQAFEGTQKQIFSMQDFFEILKELKSKPSGLQILDNKLLIKPLDQQSQYLQLPLITKQKIILHSANRLAGNSAIFINKKQLKPPYSSAVRIVCQFQIDGRIIENSGSGVIIGKKSILTVAHVIATQIKGKQQTFIAKKIRAYIQTTDGEQQFIVKTSHFPNEYKWINQTDKKKYDFAHLELPQNEIIQQNQVLKLLLQSQQITNNCQFQVIGYSQVLDKEQDKKNGCYYLKGNKFLKILQNYAYYLQKAAPGMSGGPLLIKRNGQYFVMGLHQCKQNFSYRAILINDYGRSPIQILRNLQIKENILSSKTNLDAVTDLISNVQEINKARQKRRKVYQKGLSQLELKNHDTAQKLFLYCFQLNKTIKQFIYSKENAQTLQHLGNIKRQQGNYEKAKEYYCVSWKVKDKIGQNIESSVNGIGLVYFLVKDFTKAITHFRCCLKLLKDSEKQSTQEYEKILMNLALSYFKNERFAQAILNFKQLKTKYQNTNRKNSVQHARVLNNIGQANFSLKKYVQAKRCFQQGKLILFNTKNTSDSLYGKITNNLANMPEFY